MAGQFHTEGYIKEITVKGKTIEVTLTPSDEFSFGPDRLVHQNCRQLVLSDKTGSEAKLVGFDTRFIFKVDGIGLHELYVMKKEVAKIRASVNEISKTKHEIKEISFI